MADIKKGDHVLDIACGTGVVTKKVSSKVGKNGVVVSFDISKKALEIAKGNILTNRNSWKIIKPFISIKGHLENTNIILNYNNKIICDDHEPVKVFNEHCINIIEKSSGEKPTNITKGHSFDNDKQAVDIIRSS